MNLIKKLFNSSLLVFLFTAQLFAQQNINLNLGPEIEPEKNAKFNSILGVDETSFYILRIKTRGAGTKYFVEGYDKNTKAQNFSVDLLLDDVEGALTDPAKFSVNSIAVSGRAYVFFKAYYKDAKEKILYYKSVDNKGNVSAEKEVMRINGEMYTGSFHLTVSPDRSKLALVSDTKETDQPQDVNVAIYDAKSFNLIRKFELPKSFGSSGIYSGNFILDNNGSFYFSFNYLNSKEEVGLALGSIPHNATKLKAAELQLSPKREIDNGIIKFNEEDNSITIAGMFKDEKNPDVDPRDAPEIKNGFFAFKINTEDFKILNRKEKYLPGNIYDVLNYPNGLESKIPGEKYYSAEQILKSGTTNYFVSSHSYTITSDGGQTHVGRELMVTKINQAGEIEWTQIIPKYTISSSNSFNSVVVNDQLHFLFLEHPKNEKDFPSPTDFKSEKLRSASGVRGPNAVCYTVTSDGKISKQTFHKNEEFCFVPPQQDYLMQGNNGLLVRFVKDVNEKFGTLTIK